MAAVFDFDSGSGGSLAEVDAAFASIVQLLEGLPARLAVPRSQTYRQRLSALETVLLADTINDGGGDTKLAEKVVGKSGKVSKSAVKKAVARAKVSAKNSAIADKMAKGDLTDEQVDVIADADRKTDGAASCDDDFIAEVAKAGVDQARGVAADFVTDHANADGTQSEHDRQRLLRKAIKFATDRRTEAILIDGDKASIGRLWAAAGRRAQQFYRQDGGSDLAVSKHPRTHEQRMFDALIDIFENGDTGAQGAEPATGATASDPGAQAPEPTTSTRHTPKTSKTKSSKTRTGKVTTSRPALVVTLTLEKFLGLDPDAAAEMIGTGPIADSVLAEYLNADPDIIGLVFGHRGQPLWLSRSVRLASYAQHLALVIRDKRCVLCGADHDRCRAHHIMPWNAPAKGETDITKLALVCDSCHYDLHNNHQTICQDPTTGRWQLRPALPHEIPPPRPPPKPHRGQAPQRT